MEAKSPAATTGPRKALFPRVTGPKEQRLPASETPKRGPEGPPWGFLPVPATTEMPLRGFHFLGVTPISVCACVCMCMCVYMCSSVCMSGYVCMRVQVCMCKILACYLCVCICVCVWSLSMYMCVHVCM